MVRVELSLAFAVVGELTGCRSMAEKRILTIGLQLASNDVQYVSFLSKTSLLDWDIVLFKPIINEFLSYTDYYQGKPSLSDSSSFQLKECCEHWRREIKQAVETGKTVIVFLPALQEVYIDTGERQYSGTGRNQKTTRIVSLYNNYHALPASLAPVNTQGTAIKLSPRGTETISTYWSEFAEISQYNVILSAENIPACLVTRNGDKPVGAIYRNKSSSGTLILLPDIDFYPDNFHSFHRGKGQGQVWTPVASQFASRMLGTVVSLDKALLSSGEITPEPDWAGDSAYTFARENQVRIELLEAEDLLEKAQRTKESLVEDLKSAGQLRSLLFEKGKPLENAIIDALRILGFKAAPYKDSMSEFDVVFESDEGRLIGEAEGKDNKAINVDKLRQLAMNIHEDLQREEVIEPAKGVLFGNAYRLQPVADREESFTDKCVSAAESSSTALVSTPDLFNVVRYLSNNADHDYAKRCREVIIAAVGRVSFPDQPTSDELHEEQQAGSQ